MMITRPSKQPIALFRRIAPDRDRTVEYPGVASGRRGPPGSVGRTARWPRSRREPRSGDRDAGARPTTMSSRAHTESSGS
jgi:hypothetical protein